MNQVSSHGEARSRARWMTMLAASALSVAGLVLPVTAAHASGPSLYLVTAKNPEFNGAAEVVLSCGTDSLYGVGVSDTSGGEAIVDRLEPTTTSTATVHAHEGEAGATASWTLTGYAICGPAQPKMQVVENLGTNVSPSAASTGAFADATCPSGTNVLGGGWRVNAPGTDNGQVVVTKLIPSSKDVTATAYPDPTGVPSAFSVSAFAICAALPSSANLNYPLAATSTTSTGDHGESKGCATGESRTGMGFVISNRSGDNILTRLVPTEVLTQNTSVDVDNGPAGYSKSWNLSAYAVCATL